jgi:hypothetical protein
MSTTALGLLSLALLVGSAAVWFRGAMRVAVPENRTVYVVIWFTAAALGVTSLVMGVGWVGGIAAGISAVVGLLLCMLVGISRQRVGENGITVGATIPAFSAPDDEGESFESTSLSGHTALIKFFRGHW